MRGLAAESSPGEPVHGVEEGVLRHASAFPRDIVKRSTAAIEVRTSFLSLPVASVHICELAASPFLVMIPSYDSALPQSKQRVAAHSCGVNTGPAALCALL